MRWRVKRLGHDGTYHSLEEEDMSTNVRDEAKRLIERLPDDASWEDLMQLICDREAIEAGIRDCDAGRVVSMEDVRREFGISE